MIKNLVKYIELPTIRDCRGDLTFMEGMRHVPFEIQRVYFLYNVPTGAERGGHAHKNLLQVIFALSGSFKITLDDGKTRQEVWLNNPCKGILLNNNIWREMDSFSQGSVCMVLASQKYDETDYIRDYTEFCKIAEQ